MAKPTNPYDAEKSLSPRMRVVINGRLRLANNVTMGALKWRGLVTESLPRRLTPMGECVRLLLMGKDPAALSDADRIDLAERKGDSMFGPCEWEACSKHDSHGMVTRWRWPATATDDHALALECSSDAEIVTGCPLCDEEDSDD